eukprot:gb/GEZN01007904.1/.p1 GENE.gb/GEZN01007904.1/~~gb/GEZN01007904.1/.p1  ORF type:complete len:392 (-),score=54.60 gb/GEZN01007904.1/:171-1346(-)
MGCCASTAVPQQPVADNGSKKLTLTVMGDPYSGKSQFIQHLLRSEDKEYDPTLEENYEKNVSVDGATYTVAIVDTAGQDEYEALIIQHVKGASIIIIVYQFQQRKNYRNMVEKWIPFIRKHTSPKLSVFAVETFNAPAQGPLSSSNSDEPPTSAADKFVRFEDVVTGINAGVEHLSVDLQSAYSATFLETLVQRHLGKRQFGPLPLKNHLKPFVDMNYVLENGFKQYQHIPEQHHQTTFQSLLVMSHRWVTPQDPDAKKTTISFLRENRGLVAPFSHIFYDFSSLPQPIEGKRTEFEAFAFGEALRLMGLLYSNQKVLVVPSPDYLERGWCCLEYKLAGNFRNLVNETAPYDLSKLDEMDLEKKQVANPADIPVIVQNYSDFVLRYAKAES